MTIVNQIFGKGKGFLKKSSSPHSTTTYSIPTRSVKFGRWKGGTTGDHHFFVTDERPLKNATFFRFGVIGSKRLYDGVFSRVQVKSICHLIRESERPLTPEEFESYARLVKAPGFKLFISYEVVS